MNDSFDIFFEEKRIDLKAFRESRKELCEELEKEFKQIGPRSFDQQKKFLFNPLRLDFPLKTPLLEKSKPAKAKPALRKKPVLRTRSTQEGEKETKKVPSLKKPLMKKKGSVESKAEDVKEGVKKKAPPLKRPLMKPKREEKAKAPPLKRPLMKKKEVPDANPETEKPKAPPLKRPLKRPIMKPKELKPKKGKPEDPDK